MRMMWILSTNLLSFNTHAKPVAPIAKFLLTLEKLNLSVSRKNLICQPPVDKFVKSQWYSRQRNKCQQETNTVSTQSLWFTFGSCRNISIKIECPCCNEVDVVAGITNEIKISLSYVKLLVLRLSFHIDNLSWIGWMCFTIVWAWHLKV